MVEVDQREAPEADRNVAVVPDTALVRAAVAHVDQRVVDLSRDTRRVSVRRQEAD